MQLVVVPKPKPKSVSLVVLLSIAAALHTETNMIITVTKDNEGLEPGSLTISLSISNHQYLPELMTAFSFTCVFWKLVSFSLMATL